MPLFVHSAEPSAWTYLLVYFTKYLLGPNLIFILVTACFYEMSNNFYIMIWEVLVTIWDMVLENAGRVN